MKLVCLILLCLAVIYAVNGQQKDAPSKTEYLGRLVYHQLIEIIGTNRTIDLIHCMDKSGSITKKGFKSEKTGAKIVNNMIDMLSPIVSGGTQVAVVEYSSYALTNITLHFGHATTRKQVNDFISDMAFDGGPFTATAYGLLLAYFEFYTHSPAQSPNLLWLCTDGQSSFSTGDPHWPAFWLKREGVTICAMGIGNNVNMVELQDIGSPGCVFHFPSWKIYTKALKFAARIIEEFVASNNGGGHGGFGGIGG